jgi:transcriptional regulator with XRE-family HTH domain
MGRASTDSDATATNVRNLRKLLDAAMSRAADSQTPAICVRVRKTREQLKQQWQADHPGELGNPFTQEKVASRIGVTTKTYRSWEGQPAEHPTEPSLMRLREIAGALGLDADYFSPTADLASVTARLEAEADRLTETNQQVQSLLEVLQAALTERVSGPVHDDNG